MIPTEATKSIPLNRRAHPIFVRRSPPGPGSTRLGDIWPFTWLSQYLGCAVRDSTTTTTVKSFWHSPRRIASTHTYDLALNRDNEAPARSNFIKQPRFAAWHHIRIGAHFTPQGPQFPLLEHVNCGQSVPPKIPLRTQKGLFPGVYTKSRNAGTSHREKT
jgi:hypothetical protein